MKKMTQAIALSTIVLGALSPTLQVIAETPKIAESPAVTTELSSENVEVQADSNDIASGTFGTAHGELIHQVCYILELEHFLTPQLTKTD
ncbi:hypothetical protein NF702_07495 [Lactococcus petauri]|uniref:hypothetical protein n=1 Tax=Lactococcus petauri TaxID=1940789 RepID=UPI000A90ECC2|nr:hypothetical protein [Lactococcus petauri]MDG6137078.1 hypothetical protein [Lactococcus petauri]MDT2552472.1 hypothetical protein [Lactococcus petauri]MDT2563046.1 hypothetical protein [Lactococcus petauri]MDT2575710.1 hypothetical protein [Lactococcus petauri]MDT2581910.1 hypothetical protein [Lactococcus petauri]